MRAVTLEEYRVLRLVSSIGMDRDAFVIPLKSFEVGKTRLRAAGTDEVNTLARDLASHVVRSCLPRHIIVLSESSDVTQFALAEGAEVFESESPDLNSAVQRAFNDVAERFERLIIVHGDLRYPEGLATFEPPPGFTIMADHHGTGTNVLVVPSGIDFHFAYGRGSAQRHEQEALRLGQLCNVVLDSPWRFDVDEPSDLA